MVSCPEKTFLSGLFRFFLAPLCAALLVLSPVTGFAKSALNPRHSGLEPPGGPRPYEGIPSRSPTRTAEGGMGYTDAYGNTVEDIPPPEKPVRQRLRPGAYGPPRHKEAQKLPDPSTEKPMWKFQ